MTQSLFSVRWNEYHQHLSNGLNEHMMQNAFTDVTLAADGELFNAHKNVLAACSPYFYKMFSEMPENKQGFIFLKGVSSSTLRNLMQFMYSGEVNVSIEAVSEFFSLGKELQIKGLTESNSQSTAVLPSTNLAPVTSSTPDISSRSTLRIENYYSQATPVDSHLKRLPMPFKRPQLPNQPGPSTKVTNLTSTNARFPNDLDAFKPKSSKRPLPVLQESSKRQKLANVTERNAARKSKPEFVTADQNDDSELVDEMVKGEEEFEDGNNNNAGTSSTSEAQGLMCLMSRHNTPLLVKDDFLFSHKRQVKFWFCVHYDQTSHKKADHKRCKAKLHLNGGIAEVTGEHNHGPDTERIHRSTLIPYHPSLLEKSS